MMHGTTNIKLQMSVPNTIAVNLLTMHSYLAVFNGVTYWNSNRVLKNAPRVISTQPQAG